jgi:predicted permease
MRWWNKFRARFGRAVEEDLAEEMRLHRVMLEDRFREEGLGDAEARVRAARQFGPPISTLEDSRAEWSFAWLDALRTDTRHAVRGLVRNKTFSLTAILTLGVGLALASVAFTLFNAYVLRPFAVADPGRLYQVYWVGKDQSIRMHSPRDYEEIRSRRDVFTDAMASRGVFVMGVSRHWSGKLVSGNYFRLLGARMELGRPIEDRDAQMPLGDNVIVLGYNAWKSAYQLDPGVLGRKIVLRGYTYEVIGVAAREFAGLDESPPDFWAPMSMHAAFRKEEIAVEVVGRLRHGITQAQAESALTSLATRGRPDWRASLDSRATVIAFTPILLFFFAPVLLALGLVLATCCANVANLLLARGLARQREIGIRLSVGAGRARLVRQLLSEALLISLLAGITGLLIARLTLDACLRIFYATAAPEFSSLVRLHSLELDYRVFLFALAASVVAAVGAAVLPALHATRPDLVTALRGEFSTGFRSSRLRDGLVVLQVVVCAVLLVCGALLYRRASVFQAQDTGMRQQGVITVSGGDRTAAIAAEVRLLPDVEAVAVAQRAPWFGRLHQTLVTPSGQSNAQVAAYNLVSPDYFRVFGIGLKSGRLFTEGEARSGAAVAVISQATARAFWPGEDAVGKTLRAVDAAQRHLDTLPLHGDIRVVGVAPDVIHGWVFEGRDRTCIYLPASEAAVKPVGEILTWVRGDETAALKRLRERIVARWPTFEGESMTMSTVLSVQIYPFRAAAWIGWALGLVAMVLSVSGMYGVMSYLVSQRSKEIGIRMALGASPAGVVAMVLRRSLWLSGLGVVTGAALAGGAMKLLLWWSAGLSVLTWDNVALLSGAGLAGGAAVLAAIGPSSRAARVDPNTVLRGD